MSESGIDKLRAESLRLNSIDTREALAQIERLRSLVSELLPYMLNDMEQGLQLVAPPFEIDHCKDRDILCGDCQWVEDATLWKKRVDAGEFKHYM